MTVDIIFLTLTINDELYNMTLNALNSLRASEDDVEFNIIIVESNKQYNPNQYPYDNCQIIIPDEEFNYNRFCNIGLSHSNNEWVALCNNDLLFHRNWFSAIHIVHKSNPAIRSFCPWNSHASWHERLVGGNEQLYFGYRVSKEIAGWCLVFKREILNAIKLAEHVSFWYSDNVYANSLKNNNITHCLVRASRVDHIISATTKYIEPSKVRELTDGQYENYQKNMI